MTNVARTTFLGCEVVSSSFSIGLGQAATTLNLELVESVPNGQEPTGFVGYTGKLGTIYEFAIGAGTERIFFIGLLTNHSIKVGSGGRTISVTLSDGRSMLDNIQIISGKQYGSEGIYTNCNAGLNVLSALRVLEPGVSSQFLTASDTACGNYAIDKCSDTNGFMSSFRDKHGMPTINLLSLFNTPQVIRLPLSDQTVRVDLTNLYNAMFNTKGFYSIISENSVSITQLVQSACDDIAADFDFRITEGVVGVSNYNIVVDVVDRSFVPAQYALRDYINETFVDFGNVKDVDYGQETTNTTTRKIVLGDYYRYFLEMHDINRSPGSFRSHEQGPPFITNWNSGFGNNNISLTFDNTPDNIDGIVDNEEDLIDTTPEQYSDSGGNDNDLDGLSFKAQDTYADNADYTTQTNTQDLLREDSFYEGESEGDNAPDPLPADCNNLNSHRIFQILREDIFPISSNTNIRFPPVQKVYLTRFAGKDNPSGFDIDWDIPTKELLNALQLTTAPLDDQVARRAFQESFLYTNGPPRLTLEELLASSNFEIYKKWIEAHPTSVGYYCARILIDKWTKKSDSAAANMLDNLQKSKFILGDFPVINERNTKQLELVQMHVKKIYDDYYGKEFAVLLDRKLLSHLRAGGEGSNLGSHDVCFASSYNASLAHSQVNGSTIASKIEPPSAPVSDLDEGYIYGYKISGQETNFETSDYVVDGAWPAGPSDTTILDIPVASLGNFQNSDGTIAGFVNLGPTGVHCRRLGDLWGKYRPNASQIDLDNFIIHNADLFAKAQFSPEMLVARLDDAKILSYDNGGDFVLVRFSTPKVDLTQKAITINGVTTEFTPSSVGAGYAALFDGAPLDKIPPLETTQKKRLLEGSVEIDEDGSSGTFELEVDTEEQDPAKKTDGAKGSTETLKYMDFNPLSMFPCEVAIPFQSRTQVYGPFSATADADGGTEVVDTDLAPWQFVSNLSNPNIISYSWVNGMGNAGLQIALDGVNARSFQEKATVNLPYIPSLDLRLSKAALSTAAGVFLGVVIDSINVNYGSNGASTSLTFSSYTRRFGETAEYVRNAVKSLTSERRKVLDQISSENTKKGQLAFSNALSIPEPKVVKKKGGAGSSTSPGEIEEGSPSDGGKSNKAGTPAVRFNNNASDGLRGGGGAMLQSHFDLVRGEAGSNSDEGSDVTTELRVHTASIDTDDNPVAITEKPTASTEGNKFTKVVRTQLSTHYSKDWNQKYYRNIAINSLDNVFLPVSIDGGVPGSGSGNLSSFVNTLDSCISGMRNRPYSAIPPLTISSLETTDSDGNTNSTFFDLQICSTYLNPYTTKKIMADKLDDRTNDSTVGFNVAKIAVDKDAKHFISNDKTYESVDENGNFVVEFDRQEQEDFRFNAIRGPLVLQGWGYDTDGKPIPNDNDSAKNCEEGKFRNTGLKDKFLKNWLSNPKTWPVAPIDLRFDRNRGVWVAPTHSKILLARMKENLSPNGQAEAELINLEAGDTDNKIAYYKDTNLWGPDGEDIRQDVRNATVIVYDYLGMTVSKSDFVYLYYDDGKYIVINQKSVGGGGGAVVPARTISGAGSGGTFTAEIVDAAGNFDLTTDRDNEVTVTDYLNIIPYSIPQDTPITIADIGEVNSCVVSVGVPKAGVGFNSNVGGLIFDALPIASQVPTYFLGMNGSNLVRYRGVATCDEVLS